MRPGFDEATTTCCSGRGHSKRISRFLHGRHAGTRLRRGRQYRCCLGVKLVSTEVGEPNDLDAAFKLLSNEHVQAVFILADAMLFQERQRVAELAAAARLPAVYGFRDHVDAGGLISYGVNYADNYRRAAIYVVKILNGAKPSDLPVEFPSKLELVINLKAAKALGLDFPPTLLARADEVIE
jgi:putative ABC transport system substrate-binding protein